MRALSLLLFATATLESPASQEERCVMAAQTPDERVLPAPAIAPGLPPLFSFRYYEGKLHGRFANADLMLDDAGH